MLKRVPRTGWLIRGISLGDAETVSDHVSRTILIASIISNLLIKEGIKVDKGVVMEMAVLHDLSESFLMDIDRKVATIFGLKTKNKAERKIESVLLEKLPVELKNHYNKLLDDFHNEGTLEGRIVRIADRLETLIQGSDYVKSGYPKKAIMDIYSDIERIDNLDSESVRKLITDVKKIYELI